MTEEGGRPSGFKRQTLLEMMTKTYKEATRELEVTAFQLAVTNEELKKKEKELEERLVEVMALRSLQRQQ